MNVESYALIALLTLAIFASLIVSFFFSGAETAVISANQYQLRHLHEQGHDWAKKVLAILAEPSRLLSSESLSPASAPGSWMFRGVSRAMR